MLLRQVCLLPRSIVRVIDGVSVGLSAFALPQALQAKGMQLVSQWCHAGYIGRTMEHYCKNLGGMCGVKGDRVDRQGIEIDGATYKDWHDIYVHASSEYEQLTTVLDKVIASLPATNSFLDVGAGGGSLTLSVTRHFRETVVVEPNKEVKSAFESRGIEFIGDNFQNADLGGRLFDFILCSHVFWLVRKQEQSDFVKKLVSHLSRDGKLAIVMMTPTGQCHEFHKKFFYGYEMASHDTLRILHSLGHETHVIPIHVEFSTENFDDFFSICRLFAMQSWLHPVNITDEQVQRELGDLNVYTQKKMLEMTDYIRNSCYRNRRYTMRMGVDVMVVGKESNIG